MTKILIINNDFDTMDLLKEWLERKKYLVKYTSRRQDVPEILRNFKPNLVIVDVLQKDIAENIIIEVQDVEVPVLIMTGYTGRLNTSYLPGNDVIEKPLDLNLLYSKIKKLVQTG